MVTPTGRNADDRPEINLVTEIEQRKVEKQINEDIQNMMSSLFSCLKSELDNLIDQIKRQDSLYVFFFLFN